MNRRMVIAVCAWPARILGLGLVIVALGELAQYGLCAAEARRRKGR